MTNNEKLRAQFSIAAREAKNPQDISNALADLERADGLKIADYIAAYCRNIGIDPQAPELASYFRESAEYKAKLQADKERQQKETALKTLGEKSGAYKANLDRNVPVTDKGMLELAAAISKEAAILGAEQGEISRLGSFADYIRECVDHDPDRDFRPSLFDKLAFPDSTISYIGARTGRGKTTAMVNLAREAIAPQKPRKTIFISLEMSRKQILNKLILSTAYAMSGKIAGNRELLRTRARPQTDLYHFLKGQDMEGERIQVETFREYVKKAMEHVQVAYGSSFFIYDGRGAKLPDIINMIKGNADPGTLVLLDYIQRMPSVPGKDEDTYMRVKWISDEIVNAAILSNSVIISGAQFNRMSGNTQDRDKFDDASYRESGDIEQDAHNAIGIGWKADKQARFFEIMKTREDAGAGIVFDIDFVGAYSYMAKGEKISWSKEPKPDKPNKNKTADGSPNKPGAKVDNDNLVSWGNQ